MIKNGVIAALGTLLILQHPVYAAYANIAMFLAMVSVLFYIVCAMEDTWWKYKAGKYHQRKFKKQVENIHLPQNRRHA